MSPFERASETATWLTERLGGRPDVAIVLGTGLGAFADRIGAPVRVPYPEIPHWPRSGVTGHAGMLVAGDVRGRRVWTLSGRVHLYEGHDPAIVTFPMRALARSGVRVVVLTNAAGGVDAGFAPGTLMVIDDHLNLTGQSPLVGLNDARFGPRFPDMSEIYSGRLRGIADTAATVAGVTIAHGVYAGVLGPNYETPAEIRALRALGADAVGMSTVAEAIVLRHMGVEVAGLSCISNAAAGVTRALLTEAEVLETTARVASHVAALLEGIVERI